MCIRDRASTYDTITVDVEEGKTYYAYMSGSTANIFSVSLAVGEKKQTAWADVAAPVIHSVTTDEAGAFVVDFSAAVSYTHLIQEVRQLREISGMIREWITYYFRKHQKI